MANPLPPAAWHAKPTYGYTRDSTEAYENCVQICRVLFARGWTLEAVCGMLGNIEEESYYNPWVWQNQQILASTDTYTMANSSTNGYGLVQFTPSGKYILDSRAQALSGYGPNFSDQTGRLTDGAAQCMFIDMYGDYAPTQQYPITFAEYKSTTQNPNVCVAIWYYNYERGPRGLDLTNRYNAAIYWFQRLYEYRPDTPTPPGPAPSDEHKTKWWMYTIGRKGLFWLF